MEKSTFTKGDQIVTTRSGQPLLILNRFGVVVAQMDGLKFWRLHQFFKCRSLRAEIRQLNPRAKFVTKANTYTLDWEHNYVGKHFRQHDISGRVKTIYGGYKIMKL